jgi:hypothetical protein
MFFNKLLILILNSNWFFIQCCGEKRFQVQMKQDDSKGCPLNGKVGLQMADYK